MAITKKTRNKDHCQLKNAKCQVVSEPGRKRYLYHPGDPLLPHVREILQIPLISPGGYALHKLPLVLMTPCDDLHKLPQVLLESLCTSQVLLGGLGSGTQHLLTLVHGGQCQRDSESWTFLLLASLHKQ